MTFQQKKEFEHLLIQLGARRLNQGNCIGADQDAKEIAFRLGIEVHDFPSNRDDTQGPIDQRVSVRHQVGDPLERNKDIVRHSEILIATPKGAEYLRSGTWSCVRFARRENKKVIIIWPSGVVVPENGEVISLADKTGS